MMRGRSVGLIVLAVVMMVWLCGCPSPCGIFSQGNYPDAVYSPNGSVAMGEKAYAPNGRYVAYADKSDGRLVIVTEEEDGSLLFLWKPDLPSDIKGFAWSRGDANYLAVMYHHGGQVVDPNTNEVIIEQFACQIIILDVTTQTVAGETWIGGFADYYHKMVFGEESDYSIHFTYTCKPVIGDVIEDWRL